MICKLVLTPFTLYFSSKDFRPAYGHLHEIRALVTQAILFLVCTATVTSIWEEVIKNLEMVGCELVTTCSGWCNILYEICVDRH